MPKISVILPVYNAAATLPGAIESMLAQTENAHELIVVDDGSSDGTAAYLKTLNHPRLVCVRITHGGIVAALNTGLSRARGEFIARMDADDYSYPQRLQKQRIFLEQHSHIGLVGCLVKYGGRNPRGGYGRYVSWTNGLISREQISQARFIESPFAHPSIMFRRSLLEEHGGYADGPFPEDYELILRWLSRGVEMEKVPETLLLWNDLPSRLSRTHARYGVEAFYAVKTKHLASWLTANNPHHPTVLIWGAGRVTRKRAALLAEYGIQCGGFIDIDPRKTRSPLRGVPRFYYKDIPPPGDIFILSYVGVHDARDFIAAFLEERGFSEGKNFIHCA